MAEPDENRSLSDCNAKSCFSISCFVFKVKCALLLTPSATGLSVSSKIKFLLLTKVSIFEGREKEDRGGEQRR